MQKNRLFWGIMFLLAAAFVIIGKLGYLGSFSPFSLVFTVFMLAIIAKSIPRLNFGGILFPIAFLCITYDKVLNIENLTPWTVLAVALLGSIGLSLLFHRKNHCWYSHHHNCRGIDHDPVEIIDVEDNNHIKQSTTFGSSTKYINTDNFKQADLECSFGSIQVYFNKAHVETEAIVRIEGNFCGIELYVPKEWRVENQIETVVGGVSEKGRGSISSDTAPVLKLVGELNFAGVEIIYI
ncbi:LiaF transmembrane domain-containing protein [Lacrimispora sp. 38-1]|uniref:LiaF transmembrane domain-containing protein n=1 Tax=Lacrimispora sp. 38-1 TaxID=3125778 RepID=UPI003CF0B0AC